MMLFAPKNAVFFNGKVDPTNIYERIIEVAEKGTFMLQHETRSVRVAYGLGVNKNNSHELPQAYFKMMREYIAPDAYADEQALDKDKRIFLAIDKLCRAEFMLEMEGMRGGFNLALLDKHNTVDGLTELKGLTQ